MALPVELGSTVELDSTVKVASAEDEVVRLASTGSVLSILLASIILEVTSVIELASELEVSSEAEVAEGASVVTSEVAVAVRPIEEAAITSDVDNSVEAVSVVEVVSLTVDEALPVSDAEVAVAVESGVMDERIVIA